MAAIVALHRSQRFRNIPELALSHNRELPVGGDRYTAYHAGQDLYTPFFVLINMGCRYHLEEHREA